VQREWHRLIHADRPAGWPHQFKTRPMAQIRHLQLSRRGDTRLAGCFGCHTGTHAALGTRRSDASLLAGASQGQQAGNHPVFAVGNDGDLSTQDLDKRNACRHLLVLSNFTHTARSAGSPRRGPTPPPHHSAGEPFQSTTTHGLDRTATGLRV
jgi:hypothetical protein